MFCAAAASAGVNKYACLALLSALLDGLPEWLIQVHIQCIYTYVEYMPNSRLCLTHACRAVSHRQEAPPRASTIVIMVLLTSAHQTKLQKHLFVPNKQTSNDSADES